MDSDREYRERYCPTRKLWGQLKMLLLGVRPRREELPKPIVVDENELRERAKKADYLIDRIEYLTRELDRVGFWPLRPHR